MPKLRVGRSIGHGAADGWATNTQLNQTREWTPTLDLTESDNVVISSGLGHPSRELDFGVSAAVIARTEIRCSASAYVRAVSGRGPTS